LKQHINKRINELADNLLKKYLEFRGRLGSDPIKNLELAMQMELYKESLELFQKGYSKIDISSELHTWFSNKDHIIKIIQTLFPLNIGSLGGYAHGISELLCICYGISTEYKKYLFSENKVIGQNLEFRCYLDFMKEPKETISRALSNGELKCTDRHMKDIDYHIKLIDVINWRNNKLLIYHDFCVPFSKELEEIIIKENNTNYNQSSENHEYLALKQEYLFLQEENNKLKKSIQASARASDEKLICCLIMELRRIQPEIKKNALSNSLIELMLKFLKEEDVPNEKTIRGSLKRAEIYRPKSELAFISKT
jgi:hypothetical protein